MTDATAASATASDPASAIIDISLVQVARESRQRREIETADLEDSIARRGLLQPIIVTRGYALRAGERRWTAVSKLHAAGTPIPGLPSGRIRVTWFESLDQIEGEIVELEENVKRRDLTWQDQVRAVGKIHRLYQTQDSAWSQDATSVALGMAKSHLSMFLRVGQNLTEPRILECKSAREAWNLLSRRDQREHGNQLDELIQEVAGPGPSAPTSTEGLAAPGTLTSGNAPSTLAGPSTSPAQAPVPPPPPPRSEIRCANFAQWITTYSGPKFSIVHCDFPYGVNLFDGEQGRGAEPTDGYTDTPDVYFALLETLCRNLDRVMSLSSHLIFWFSAKHRTRTMELFRTLAPSLEFYPYDLIWHKSDNAGIAGDARRHPRHTHETALFATRGRRMLVGIKADSVSSPTARNEHASCKPAPVLRHFFEMLVDPAATLFDPTCGSGMAVRVADELGAARALGLEIDPGTADKAAGSLAREQATRRAAKQGFGL